MNFRYFRIRTFAAAALVAGALLGVACSEEIEAGKPIDETPYETIYETNGYLLDQASNQSVVTIAPTGQEYTATLSFGLTRAYEGTLSARASVDAAYLESYNAANGTAYELYPETLVSFANDGAFTVSETDATRATATASVSKARSTPTRSATATCWSSPTRTTIT